MNKVLVLAGGFPQISLIKQLKERGYYVILADWNEEPVAKKYADKYYRESTLDVGKIKEIAIFEDVSFLITVCTDQALLTVAKVSEELNLPCYIDYITALNVTNKQYMKRLFIDNNIPTARFELLDCNTLINNIQLKYPLIVKPVDCNSSKGVRKVFSIDELKEAKNDAIRLSRTNTAIVEEFISGKEISIDCFIVNGKAIVLNTSILDKIPENDKFIIYRSIAPAVYDKVLLERIEEVCQKIADAFQLKNTPMLVQAIVDENEIKVLEFSARTGGGEKFITINELTGVDVISGVIDLFEGKCLSIVPHYEQTICASEFMYCHNGCYDHMENVEPLVKYGIISYFMPFKWQGAEFSGIENSGDRVAGFIIKGKSLEELNAKHQIALSNIKVISKEGKDMLRRDLLPNIEI